MLNSIIDWSAKNRVFVLLLAAALVIWGGARAADADMDVFPEFAPPIVVVETDAPGMVAEEVESLVSYPLETAINGTPSVASVRSISSTGVSVITVVFNYGTDIYTDRQLINEKIQLAQSRLPASVHPPIMLPVMSAVGDILKIGLTSDKLSSIELRTLADWTVRNRLLSVPGVARAYIIGGEQKEYRVLVNPEKLKAFGVTLDQVRRAVQGANVSIPAGFMFTADQQLPIRTVARTQSVEDIGNSVVFSRGGTPVLVKHVATVDTGAAFKVGDAIIDGKPGVEIVISRQPNGNTLEVTRRVKEALQEVKRALPPDVRIVNVFEQGRFIQRSIANVVEAIVTGGILVVIVLLIFLLNWRTALISLTAIPLSLLSAVLIIKSCGGSINTMTLGGLAIAVGEVVDDAIVDVENVYRRLREARLKDQRVNVLKVIVDACKEVRSPVVYATFIVVLVFVPVFCLTGTEGKIFNPLASAYVAATLSSLVVALAVTPAMCSYLLTTGGSIQLKEPYLVHKIRGMYGRLLSFVFAKPKAVVVSAFTLFLLSLLLLPMMGREFLPAFREESLVIGANGLPGQSLQATTRMGAAVERNLLLHSEVAAITQRAGRAELDDDAGGPNFSEFDVQLKPTRRSLAEILQDIRHHMANVPGVTYEVGSFIQHRMDDVLSGGTRSAIAIKVFGPDLPTLRSIAGRVTIVLKNVPGAVDVRAETLVDVPQVEVRIKRDLAGRYGITAEDLSRNLETAFNGAIVSQVLEGQKLFGLKIWLVENERDNLDEIKNMMIDTADGSLVPLEQVADIRIARSPNTVIRENVARRIVVQANTAGRDLVSIVDDARAKLSKMDLPPGYYLVYAGQYAAQQEATQRLLFVSILALSAIFILLRQGLGSWKSALLVGANLPLATIGGIIAIALSGNVISMGSLIGFISLLGVSTRNSLLLVTHIDDLQKSGMPSDEAIWKGALDRVCPVLMTALTAALGMLPLAVLGGAGRELEQPLALVIVGGMVTSTALTLLVVPALFMIFKPFRPTPVLEIGMLAVAPVSTL